MTSPYISYDEEEDGEHTDYERGYEAAKEDPTYGES